MRPRSVKSYLIKQAFEISGRFEWILSCNLVGSFPVSKGLSGISDIDTVMIVDHLDEFKFQKILDSFEGLREKIKNQTGLNLKINSTFGPLKYNDPDTVVYHVMIYDIYGHIAHCRRSPFTCYDWQRTKCYDKAHMSEIYKVRTLFPSDFFHVRRGIQDYLKDFKNQTVSYRYYLFYDKQIHEEKTEKPMSVKDRCEFAYHIIRFTMLNAVKLMTGKNRGFSNQKLLRLYKKYFPSFDRRLESFFKGLEISKKVNEFDRLDKKNDHPYQVREFSEVYQTIKIFLEKFKKDFQKHFPENRNLFYFVRHEKTDKNDGKTFLGSSDPSVVSFSHSIGVGEIRELPVKSVFSSPLKRAVDTARFFFPDKEIYQAFPLKEINYGKAEGRDLSWLKKHDPRIIKKWTQRKDPRFPGGENQIDVKKRVFKFVKTLIKKRFKRNPGTKKPSSDNGNIFAFTHNVVLRAVIGTTFRLPVYMWYKIEIPHAYPLKFRIRKPGRLIADTGRAAEALLFSKIDKQNVSAFLRNRDPHRVLKGSFWEDVYTHFYKVLSNRHTNEEISEKDYDHTLLIPMAGEGSRFKTYGFQTAKPLISVDGSPMVMKAAACLPKSHHKIYLVRRHHLSESLEKVLKESAENVQIIPVKKLTEGQAATCLLAQGKAPAEKPLLIAPCDNGMLWNSQKFDNLLMQSPDIICFTFTRQVEIIKKPQAWGYVKCRPDGRVESVSVKEPFEGDPFEQECVIGTFWFKSATLFEKLAGELVAADIRVNGEFYVDSIIGYAAEKGYDVRTFVVDKYISWGKPEDLLEYRKQISLRSLFDQERLRGGIL